MKLLLLELVCLIVFLCQISHAQTDILIIDEQISAHRLNDYLAVHKDSAENLSLQAVIGLPPSSFQPLRGEVYKFYQSKAHAAHWFRLQVENRSEEQFFYLTFAPRMDTLEIYYQLANGRWESALVGLKANTSLGYFNFYLDASVFIRKGKSELYFRASGSSILHRDRGVMTGHLRNSEAFHQHNSLENLGFGLLFGILPLIFLYNVWVYSLAKGKAYKIFLCSCFIDILFVYHLAKPNLLWAYFGAPFWAFYLYHPLSLLSIVARAWFTQHFLATERYAPWADKMLDTIKIIALLSLGFMPLGYLSIGTLVAYLLFFAIFGTTIVASIQIRRVSREVDYFLFTNVVSLCSMLLVVYRLGAIGYMDFTNWVLMPIGQIFYFLMLSRNLALYIIELQKEVKEKEHSLKNEKERISRDLHDNIGSRLTYLVRSLDRIKDAYEQKSIDELSVQTKNIIDDLRSTVWILSKENPSLQDFYDRILKLIEQMQAQEESIAFSLDLQGIEETYFTANQAINLYRIVQEALHNIIKYSGASMAKVEIYTHQFAQKPFLISIKIIDNGKGFDLSEVSDVGASHFGLQGMKQRASEIGGTLFIQTAKNAGTAVEIHL